MQSQLSIEVQKALEESSNPDRQIAQQAETFFFEQHLNNPNLYEILFNISSNQNTQNNINLKAVIILKKIIEQFFSKLNSQIQNQYVNYILTYSLRQRNHQILQIQMQILKKALQVFQKDQDQNLFTQKIKNLFQSGNFDAEKYYALLLIVQVFLNEHQHASREDRNIIDNFINQIFPLLNDLIKQLSKAENMTIMAMFSHILSKIFFRAFRYNPTSIILQTEFYITWFDLFSFILKQQQNDFLKAKKWITRSLLVFYRLKKSENQKNLQGSFWNDWSNKYSNEFFVIMLEQIYYIKNLPQYYKINQNISRSFLFYINKDIINNYIDKILLIMQKNMFQLLEYNQDQKDRFYDNPVEFLKQNIWNFQEDNVRDSITFMFQIFFRNGMSLQIKQILQDKLSTQNDIESSLFLVQKLFKEMIENFDSQQNLQFFQQLVEQIIIPNLTNKDDFIRMRCCAIIETINSQIQNQDLIKNLTQIICNSLQDNQMVVKSFAAISLGCLMKLNIVKQMMNPYLEQLLQIYVSLIKKCDNETLINSFTKIIYQYKDQLGSYAVDLVQQFLEILINLFEKKQDKLEDIESKYFTQLETFEAIKLLFKSKFNKQQLIKTFDMIDIVFQKLMQNKLINQALDSMLEIFQELLQKNIQDQFYEPFWKYFEFFTRTIINPPSKDQYQNQLFLYTNNIEQEIDLTTFLRLYIQQDKQTLLNGKDEFGVSYIDILIQCVQKLDKVMGDPLQGMLVPIKTLKTDLIWLLKDVNHPIVINYIEEILKVNVQNIIEQLQQEQDIVDQQINWRNFGISMYFYPQQINQLLQNNPISNLVQIWKECNYHLMTQTMRLGSYLGLLQFFKQLNIESSDTQLIEFVIMELIFINYQRDQENIIDLDQMINEINDNEEEEDTVVEKPQKLLTMQSVKQLHKYFEDNFIMECEECYLDTQGMLCYLENQDLKQLVLQIYPNILSTQNFKDFYDQQEPEIKKKIEYLFSIYEQDFESRLGLTFLLKQISFVLSYFLFSRLFLNFVSRKIFKSDFVFTWRFENFIN